MPSTGRAASRRGGPDVVLRVGRGRPRAAGTFTVTRPPGSDTVKSPAGGDAALHRRRIGRGALDRDRDPEQRAGAAGVLELAREDVQAVGERAGRERERRLPEMAGAGAATPSSSAPGAVTGSFAVRTIWLAEVETEPSAGVDETRVGAVLSKRTFVAERRRGGVVERVVADGAEVVEAIGEGRRVERSAERSARVVRDLRPRAGAGRARRRRRRVRAAAGGRGQRDRSARRRRPDRRARRSGRSSRARTDTTAVVLVLPAASVTTARITVAPSGELVEFQVAEYGRGACRSRPA